MNKPAKSNQRNKHRRKKPTQSTRKAPRPTSDKGLDTKSSRPRSEATDAINRRGGENEGKRLLWDRKQAELEARWVAAQAKQTSEEMARRRNAKIVRSATGIAALLILLCAMVLYYTHGSIIPA